MLEVDKKTFEDEVLKAEGYVFVDFFGDGCVPCQALMPFVHEMADKYGDKIKFTSLNTTKARRLAIGQKILGLPVMAIYKDGEKVEEVVKVTAQKMHTLGIHNGTQLQACTLEMLTRQFGKAGNLYYDFARGIDLRVVYLIYERWVKDEKRRVFFSL